MWIAEVPCLFRFVRVGEIQRVFVGVFNKTIIPLALVGYEMIIANSALRASLVIYHLISNAPSWNNSMLPRVCSVIDHRWRQNVVKTKKWHTSRRRVCHWCFYHIVTSSMIYYWTDPRQHEIYLFYTMIRKENRPIHIPAIRGFVLV